jgi:hypothetical protein
MCRFGFIGKAVVAHGLIGTGVTNNRLCCAAGFRYRSIGAAKFQIPF